MVIATEQLVCRELLLGYDGRPVAGAINMTVSEGDYLCIVGENGSGKTTFMKTLLGLVPPLGGEISAGNGIYGNGIGYLPQQTAIQKDFPATVWEIVLSGCQGRCGMRPFYNRTEKETARVAIAKMRLDGMERRCYRDLSGGQQQRVLLARALCAASKVLLLDEPSAGLDPKVTEEMYLLTQKLNVEDGITIIMVTHDVEASLKYASHILHIGDTVFFGTKDEYIKSGRGVFFAHDREAEQ